MSVLICFLYNIINNIIIGIKRYNPFSSPNNSVINIIKVKNNKKYKMYFSLFILLNEKYFLFNIYTFNFYNKKLNV